VAGRRDEIQVAANALLCWVQIAQVVSAIDDPEFFVSGRRVEDFFVHRKHDECREANLGVNRNDVGLRILHFACAGIGKGVGRRDCKATDNECSKNYGSPYTNFVRRVHSHSPLERTLARSAICGSSFRGQRQIEMKIKEACLRQLSTRSASDGHFGSSRSIAAPVPHYVNPHYIIPLFPAADCRKYNFT